VQKEAAFTMADAVRDKLRGPAKAGEIAVQVATTLGRSCVSELLSKCRLNEKTSCARVRNGGAYSPCRISRT
jgi:hypothetical protein